MARDRSHYPEERAFLSIQKQSSGFLHLKQHRLQLLANWGEYPNWSFWLELEEGSACLQVLELHEWTLRTIWALLEQGKRRRSGRDFSSQQWPAEVMLSQLSPWMPSLLGATSTKRTYLGRYTALLSWVNIMLVSTKYQKIFMHISLSIKAQPAPASRFSCIHSYPSFPKTSLFPRYVFLEKQYYPRNGFRNMHTKAISEK